MSQNKQLQVQRLLIKNHFLVQWQRLCQKKTTHSFIAISPFKYPTYVKNYSKYLDHYIFNQHGTASHALQVKERYYHAFDPMYFKDNDDH